VSGGGEAADPFPDGLREARLATAEPLIRSVRPAATGDPAIPAPPLCGRRVGRDEVDNEFFSKDVCETTQCSEARSVISAFESANGGLTRAGAGHAPASFSAGSRSETEALLPLYRARRAGGCSRCTERVVRARCESLLSAQGLRRVACKIGRT
jgi:hypothetical protein